MNIVELRLDQTIADVLDHPHSFAATSSELEGIMFVLLNVKYGRDLFLNKMHTFRKQHKCYKNNEVLSSDYSFEDFIPLMKLLNDELKTMVIL